MNVQVHEHVVNSYLLRKQCGVIFDITIVILIITVINESTLKKVWIRMKYFKLCFVNVTKLFSYQLGRM